MGRIIKYSEPVEFHKAMPGSKSVVIWKRDEPAPASTAKTPVIRKVDVDTMTDYDTSRGPWHAMIDRQALARQAQTGETYQKAYTECYCDPRNTAIVNELKYNDLAKSHDAIYRTRLSPTPLAKAVPAYDPLAKAAELAEIRGPAHAKLHSLAIDHQRAHPGMSYQSAYGYLYAKPENAALRNAIKAEHMSATMSAHGAGEIGKAAPADPAQDDVSPESANYELHRLVVARMNREPKLSYEQAFTREYLHPDNRSLKDRVTAEGILHMQSRAPVPSFPAYSSPDQRGPSNLGRSGAKPAGYAGG
jgi:hypothetical protein